MKLLIVNKRYFPRSTGPADYASMMKRVLINADLPQGGLDLNIKTIIF